MHIYVMSVILGVTLRPCAMIALFGVLNEEMCMTKKRVNILASVSLLAIKANFTPWKIKYSAHCSTELKDVILILHLEMIKFATRGSD